MCRMCKNREETVTHIISECSKLAQLEYKTHKVAGAVHWSLWYQHTAEPVIETESVKILWDMNIQTDHSIEHRRPDIVVVDKDNKRALPIDIVVPADASVEKKEQEKMDRYQDLARELKRLWKVETKVISIVVGALGTVPKCLEKKLKKAGSNVAVELLEKAAVLGTSQILRRVLDSD